MSSVENFWPMFRPTSPRLCAKIVLLHALRFTRHKIGYSGDVLLGRSLSFVLNKLDVMPNSHCPNRREKTVLSQRVGRCALSMTQHTRTNWPKWKTHTHEVKPALVCWTDDLLNRLLNGRVARIADYDALVELATVCSMCNDSSVDYNEARG